MDAFQHAALQIQYTCMFYSLTSYIENGIGEVVILVIFIILGLKVLKYVISNIYCHLIPDHEAELLGIFQSG